MFNTVLQSLIMLCLIIFAGAAAWKLGIINDETNAGLAALLLRITLPCTIIMAMQRPYSPEMMIGGLIVFGVSSAAHFAGAGAGLIVCALCKVGEKERGVWLFASAFANVGYMGLPVINAVYGQDGMFYAAMYNASFNLLISSLGVMLLQRGAGFRLNINEPIVATLIGMLLFAFSVSLPAPLAGGLSLLGGMTTPVAMLIVGAFLAQNRLKDVFADVRIYALAAARLLALPLITFFLARLFIANGVMLGVLVCLTAMPTAAITVVFAKRYGGDAAAASRVVFITMVASVVTLPLISMLL